MKAVCQCGGLAVDLPDEGGAVVACHCIDCQRRTGSHFGVLAYYPAETLTISGEATRFERPTATGGTFETYFCPRCGSTVYARASKHPAMIGVAVGAIADPAFAAPVRSVWEQSKHAWIVMPPGAEAFSRGRT